jgi:ABC-type nickel/cobalt efflux system permease component RcnA
LKKGSIIASFALGVVLYASNIASLPEWIFITAFLKNEGLMDEGFRSAMAFALGAGIGTAGWFFTLTRYFRNKRSSLQPKTLSIINRVAGIAMLAFGIYFGYQIIFKTDWSKVNQRVDDTIKQSVSNLPIRDHTEKHVLSKFI